MLTHVPAFPFQGNGIFKIAQHRPIVGRLSRTLGATQNLLQDMAKPCKTNKSLDPNRLSTIANLTSDRIWKFMCFLVTSEDVKRLSKLLSDVILKKQPTINHYLHNQIPTLHSRSKTFCFESSKRKAVVPVLAPTPA